ncbi:MAG: hypothetical protein U1E50_11060 [Caulobacteraceae bacterium]
MKSYVAAFMLSIAIAGPAWADAVDDRVLGLQQSWDHISYEMPANARPAAMAQLDARARTVVSQSPGRAEPLVWAAIIFASEAGLKGGLSALSLVKDAKAFLERAEAINGRVLDGSVYTTLGSLYAQVPGAPLAFGDHAKARSYLQRALTVNPTGIDPNFYMGDLLFRDHDYAGAVRYLQRAIAAPARPGRSAADAGRRAEARALLAKAQSHL